MERRGFMGHHGHVFIEPGPDFFSTDVTGAHECHLHKDYQCSLSPTAA